MPLRKNNSRVKWEFGSQNQGNAATKPSGSKFNKAVARKYKVARKVPRKKADQNKSAIMTLSRQVKSLQLSQFGQLQSHTQSVTLSGTSNLPQASAPVAFCVNNFYDQMVYKGTIVAAPAPTLWAASFANTQAFFRPDTPATDLGPEYQWNYKRNLDEVSTDRYLPIYTKLNISIKATIAYTTPPGFARITLVKLKPFVQSNKFNCTIPGALGAYRNLALRAGNPTRNFFNPKYHQVIADRWVKIHDNYVNNSGESKVIERFVNFTYKHPPKPIAVNIAGTPTGQEFWSNVPTHEQVWCIISMGQYADDVVSQIAIMKYDTWRDDDDSGH